MNVVQEALYRHLEWDPECIQIEKITSGFTNQSYRVQYKHESYFVRLNADDPELRAISRSREQKCVQHAASLGITPAVICATDELLVLAFVEGEHRPVSDDFDTNKNLIARLAELHRRTQCTAGEHPVASTRMFLNLPGTSSVLSSVFSQLECTLNRIEAGVKLDSYALCHMDPNPWNVLYTEGCLYLIDWEYAAYSDPSFDIAMLAIHHDCSLETYEQMMVYHDSCAKHTTSHIKSMEYYVLAAIRRGLWNAMFYQRTQNPTYKQAAGRWIEKALLSQEESKI